MNQNPDVLRARSLGVQLEDLGDADLLRKSQAIAMLGPEFRRLQGEVVKWQEHANLAWQDALAWHDQAREWRGECGKIARSQQVAWIVAGVYCTLWAGTIAAWVLWSW